MRGKGIIDMATCGISRIFNPGSQLFRGSNIVPWRLAVCGGARNLFTNEALGLDSYRRQREKTLVQFTGMESRFREKMGEFTQSETKNMIFTEDLKNMVHLVENKPEDLSLIHIMMKRFNQQNRHLRFGNFVFGPVVMRMYCHLNEPTKALEVFKDPDLDGFFDQFASFQILSDLLYRNALYKEVLDVFEMVKTKQLNGNKYPKNVLTVALASCYKMNNVESYEYALKIMAEMKENGTDVIRKGVSFVSTLALNQNAPQVALELVSILPQSNYVTIRNIKLWALAEMNRPEDTLPILRFSIEFDSPDNSRKQSVCPEVLDKVKESVERFGNKEVTVEFERIHKALVDTNQISKSKLSDILEEEIQAYNPNQQNDQRFPNRQAMVDRSFRVGQSTDLRPRRNEVYNNPMRARQGQRTNDFYE